MAPSTSGPGHTLHRTRAAFPDVQSYAHLGGSIVRLNRGSASCSTGSLTGRPTFPERRTVGAALNILAHEASHAKGVADEATAACYGLRWTDDLALRLFALLPWQPRAQRYIAQSRRAHDAAGRVPEHLPVTWLMA